MQVSAASSLFDLFVLLSHYCSVVLIDLVTNTAGAFVNVMGFFLFFCFFVCLFAVKRKKTSAAKSLKPKRFVVFDHSEMPVVCALSEILKLKKLTHFIMEAKR